MARKKKPVRYYSAKRRSVYAQGDLIDAYTLFELYGWTCCLCNKQINKHIRLPNYMAATIEHLIPLRHGGTHTWENVRPSHASCNFTKADSLPDTGQMPQGSVTLV